MTKKRIVRVVCMILLASALLTLYSCSDDECEIREMTPEERLAEYVRRANERLRVQCFDEIWGCTRKRLNENLFNFTYIQDLYSGKKLCTVEEVTYKYPKYRAVWENKDHPVTENTRYYVVPLDRDDIGLYTGIKIIPFDAETDKKVEQMNELVRSFKVFSTRKQDVEALHEAYKPFQSKYSGALLYVDEYKGEIHCPNYTWEMGEKDRPDNSEAGNYVTVWYSSYRCNGKHGFYTGILIGSILMPVKDDYTAKTGEVVYFKKSLSHKYAEEPVEDGWSPAQRSLDIPDPCMMPDLAVKLD